MRSYANFTEYAKDMREITLKRFFLEDVSAEALAEDVSGSVIHLDQIASTVQIEDMKEQFELQREHVIRLCEAALQKTLPPASLDECWPSISGRPWHKGEALLPIFTVMVTSALPKSSPPSVKQV
jgi:hypothetical protein